MKFPWLLACLLTTNALFACSEPASSGNTGPTAGTAAAAAGRDGSGASSSGGSGTDGDDTAAGAKTGAAGSANPASLRVEFEELALDGEPSFITDFAFYPGSETDFLALDKSGKLMRYSLSDMAATLVSSAQLQFVYDNLDCGAIALAFEPKLELGNYVYVGTCVSQTASRIYRLSLDEDLNVLEGTEAEIIEVGFDAATRPWHNVGSIGFDDGGVMWALFGEKVQGAPAQDTAQELGKLLRIVPSRSPAKGGYEPASDNPLVGKAGQAESVYALGLRSPFRGTLDSRGRYWIGDVGSDKFEEVNVVREPLQNLGWPNFEGPCDACGDTTSPNFWWGRGASSDYIADDPEVETTLARVAWAGPEVLPHDPDRYGGLLAGSVLFGDYCAGFMRQGRVDEDGVPTLDAPLGHLNNAAALRQHTDGYVYAITFGRCQTDVDNQADEAFSRMYRMVIK